jgi:hypothetical protein
MFFILLYKWYNREAYVQKKIAEGKSNGSDDGKKGKKRLRDNKKDDKKESKDGAAASGDSKEAAAPAEATIVPDLIIAIDAMPEGASREDLKVLLSYFCASVSFLEWKLIKLSYYVDRISLPQQVPQYNMSTIHEVKPMHLYVYPNQLKVNHRN